MNRKISIHSPSKKGNLMAAESPIQVPTDTCSSVQKKKHATFGPPNPNVKQGDLKDNSLEERFGHSLKQKNRMTSNPLDREKKGAPPLSIGFKKTKKKYEKIGPPKPIVGQIYLKGGTSEECGCSALKEMNKMTSDAFTMKNKDDPPVSIGAPQSSIEKLVEQIIEEAGGVTDYGDPINREVLKKYLLEVNESEGFYFSEFPGSIEASGMPEIFPNQQVLDNRHNRPEVYDKYLFLASFAVAKYNKDYGTYYKVVEIEHLNVMLFRHYITFSAIDVRSTKKGLFSRLFFQAFYFVIILVLWFCGFYWREALGLIRRWTLLVLLAKEDELQAGRSTFRAVVADYETRWVREVEFCKLLKED